MSTPAAARFGFAQNAAGSIFRYYNSINTQEVIQGMLTMAHTGDQQAAAFISQLASVAMGQKMVATFQDEANLDKVNVEEAAAKFLDDKRKQSKYTATAYRASLRMFKEFCTQQGIDARRLTPSQADDFVRWLQDKGMGSATVSLRKSTLKAFYNFLIRETDGAINVNPFIGSSVRIKAKPVYKCAYPSADEVKRIIAYFEQHEATGRLAQLAALMAFDGFRVGAFKSMTIKGGKAQGTSKGKEYAKRLSQASLDALEGEEGELFSFRSTLQWQHLFQEHITKMYKAGLIREEYSPHDFRHFFATELYKATKDIKAVQRALNHASVGITDIYLKGLGVDD